MAVAAGTAIVTERDAGDYFYVAGTGTVAFAIGGREVGSASAGSSFGEQALLYASVAATTDCRLFWLDQETFRRTLVKQMEASHEELMATLKQVPLFKDLDAAYLNKISHNLKLAHYENGEVLADKVIPRQFFVIKSGAVAMNVNTTIGAPEYNRDDTLTAGMNFG